MADRNTDPGKMSPGCFGKMQEMMQNMMSKKGGCCCPCAGTMAEMMPGCSPDRTEKESPADKQAQDAPK